MGKQVVFFECTVVHIDCAAAVVVLCVRVGRQPGFVHCKRDQYTMIHESFHHRLDNLNHVSDSSGSLNRDLYSWEALLISAVGFEPSRWSVVYGCQVRKSRFGQINSQIRPDSKYVNFNFFSARQ